MNPSQKRDTEKERRFLLEHLKRIQVQLNQVSALLRDNPRKLARDNATTPQSIQ